MLFQKGKLSIRYVVEDDANMISKWLTTPEVLQYYEGRDNPQTPEQVRAYFVHNIKSDEKKCLVEYAGEQIGYVQMYPIDSEWKSYMDIEKIRIHGAWINLLESQHIGIEELVQSLCKLRLHILSTN